MKIKTNGWFIALAILFIPLIAGCEGGATNLNMATGGVAGTYYPLGGAMATVVNNRTDVNITSMASGASVSNVEQLYNNDAQLALVQNDILYYAFHGTGIWEGRTPITNIAALMTLYPETLQVVVLEDSGIYSLADLNGMRVSVGDAGSGTEANARQLLGAYGLTFDDITVIHQGFAASADLMRDLNLDAFFITAATPNTAVMELNTARDLRILTLSDEAIDHLLSTYSFFAPDVITSDAYPWLGSETVQTVAVQATLVARADLDDEIVYDIVRALIEGSDEIGHARGANINAHNAVQALSIPLHPGAYLFFDRIGALE
ncbi:MAG: TAXI family TRAP transporter solute-binding subunit [Defluviitaleaceae bacterium]|nr:TAXI family TRAP transporter solute-binding subunit [Defluviitaleaceae bacterium]